MPYASRTRIVGFRITDAEPGGTSNVRAACFFTCSFSVLFSALLPFYRMRPCVGKNDRALRALTEPGKKGPMEEGAAAAGQGPWPASLPPDSPDPRRAGPPRPASTRGGGTAACLVERARPGLIRRGTRRPLPRPSRPFQRRGGAARRGRPFQRRGGAARPLQFCTIHSYVDDFLKFASPLRNYVSGVSMTCL